MLSLLACPENRRKNLDSRLSALWKSSSKGVRLESADLNQASPASLKILKEILNALFSSNTCKWAGADFTGKSGSRVGPVSLELLEILMKQYPGCEFVLYYDSDQITTSFLKNALRKTSQGVSVQEISLDENALMKCSHLLSQTALLLEETQMKEVRETEKTDSDAAGIWKPLKDQLESMIRHHKDWEFFRGEILVLSDRLSSLQKETMASLLEKRPELSLFRIWQQLSRTPLDQNELELAGTLLEKMSDKDLETLSLNRLKKEGASLIRQLESEEHPEPEKPQFDEERLNQQKEDFLQGLSRSWSRQASLSRKEPVKLSYRDLEELIPAVIHQILQEKPESRKSRRDYYLSLCETENGMEALILKTDQGRLLETLFASLSGNPGSGQSLARLRNDELLKNTLRKQKDLVLLKGKRENLADQLFGLLRREEEGKKVIHAPLTDATWIKQNMLEKNVFYDLQADCVHESPILYSLRLLQKDPDSKPDPWKPEGKANGQTVPYFSEDGLYSSLDSREQGLLFLPEFSVALTRRLALAFSKGLDAEKVLELTRSLDGEDLQQQLRQLILPYLFTARFVRLFQSRAADKSLEEFDFVTLPGISYAKAELLLNALDEFPLALVQRHVSRSSTLTSMEKAIESLRKETVSDHDCEKPETGSENTEMENGKQEREVEVFALPGDELQKMLDWMIRQELQKMTPELREKELQNSLRDIYEILIFRLYNIKTVEGVSVL